MGFANKYPDVAERFVYEAHREDKSIKDFSDFVDAIKSYLGTSKSGESALGFIEDEDYKKMFESSENKKLMAGNLNEKEFNEIFQRIDDEVVGDVDYSVIKKKEHGKRTNEQEVLILRTPKRIEVESYKKSSGNETHFYVKGYSNWTSNEESYIRNLKNSGVPYNQALIQFRNRFRTSERTNSSIKTKFYRI